MSRKIKRRMTRMGPALVSRSGRRCPLGMFVGVCLLVSVFCFTVTFLTSRVQDIPPTAKLRLGVLSSWTLNQSLCLEDYIETGNVNSFLRQPLEATLPRSTSLPSFCGGSDVKILILVTSAPNHALERQAIRDTWGHPVELQRKFLKLFFVLGRSANDTDEEEVGREESEFGDILEEDFADTYHNLTLKTASLLKWVNLTCFTGNVSTMPSHILKVDDDMFINIDRLFNVIHQMPQAQMIGRLICGAEPVTDRNSKLFMPQYLFPGKMYPGYLSGTAYVLTGAVVGPLLEMSLTTPLIHMEDIYLTGIVARKAGIFPEDSSAFTYLRVDSKDMCLLKEMVSSHTIEPSEMRRIWSLWEKENTTTSACASTLTPAYRRKFIRRPAPRLKNMNKRLKKLCQFPT